MTVTELKERVLIRLAVLAAGESAVADDAELVGTRYTALHDMLITEGLASWTPVDDIPDWAELPVIAMTAAVCAHEFGVIGQRFVELQVQGALNLPPQQGGPSLAERQLRKQTANAYVPHQVKTVDY